MNTELQDGIEEFWNEKNNPEVNLLENDPNIKFEHNKVELINHCISVLSSLDYWKEKTLNIRPNQTHHKWLSKLNFIKVEQLFYEFFGINENERQRELIQDPYVLEDIENGDEFLCFGLQIGILRQPKSYLLYLVNQRNVQLHQGLLNGLVLCQKTLLQVLVL